MNDYTDKCVLVEANITKVARISLRDPYVGLCNHIAVGELIDELRVCDLDHETLVDLEAFLKWLSGSELWKTYCDDIDDIFVYDTTTSSYLLRVIKSDCEDTPEQKYSLKFNYTPKQKYSKYINSDLTKRILSGLNTLNKVGYLVTMFNLTSHLFLKKMSVNSSQFVERPLFTGLQIVCSSVIYAIPTTVLYNTFTISPFVLNGIITFANYKLIKAIKSSN